MKAAARFSLARVSGKGSERTVVNAAASWPESASRPTVENVGWVTKGKRSSEIAPVLDLSIHTVRKHLENAFAKLGVDNRTATSGGRRTRRRGISDGFFQGKGGEL